MGYRWGRAGDGENGTELVPVYCGGDKGDSICVCEGSKIITVGLNIVLGYAWNWYFCCIFVGLNS